MLRLPRILMALIVGAALGETPMITLILAGVITGSLFSALVSILKYIAQDAALRGIVFWLMGGFYYATWSDVLWLFPVVGGCILIMGRLGWQLNILSLGDAQARSLGLHAEVYRDFSNQLRIWRLIQRVSRQGVTVLACTHNPNHVAWFCDQVLVMHQGAVLTQGPPQEVIREPVLNAIYDGSCAIRYLEDFPVVLPGHLCP